LRPAALFKIEFAASRAVLLRLMHQAGKKGFAAAFTELGLCNFPSHSRGKTQGRIWRLVFDTQAGFVSKEHLHCIMPLKKLSYKANGSFFLKQVLREVFL